jgi:KipI family sensor histidine kinase inhibitor
MSVTDLSMEFSKDPGHSPVKSPAVLDYGDHALLLQCASTAEVLAWTAALRAAGLPGVVDIVPASRTVLLKLDAARYQAVTRQRVRKLRVTPRPQSAVPSERSADVVIDVVYDGPDLAEVASHTGLTTAQVIHAHTASLWRVGFSGFAPGFAYLVDGDARLRVPRQSEPRTSVPSGSVALAGEFSAIYPRQSPGGWQLIGHTDAVLWDIERPHPALLTQGMWVQFRAA